MADLSKALAYTLPFEGGWSDRPTDHGGPTMKGITLKLAMHYGITTEEKLRTISDAKIEEIAGAEFWRFDNLTSQRVASKIFDYAFNAGLHSAITLAQGACNVLGDGLIVDGVYGPHTEAAINAAEPSQFLEEFSQLQAHRYRNIVAANPSQAEYLHGWLNRANSLPPEDL